jgi:hypothetical protein
MIMMMMIMTIITNTGNRITCAMNFNCRIAAKQFTPETRHASGI